MTCECNIFNNRTKITRGIEIREFSKDNNSLIQESNLVDETVNKVSKNPEELPGDNTNESVYPEEFPGDDNLKIKSNELVFKKLFKS